MVVANEKHLKSQTQEGIGSARADAFLTSAGLLKA